MTLQSEISANYLDATGLVCNRKCAPTELNPSGNGVCYTGEYVSILKLRGELTKALEMDFFYSMSACMLVPGLLDRGPGDQDQISVDDFYGFAAGCTATDHEELAQLVIDYGWSHLGSYNTNEPGKWTSESFLWRQPQLLVALYSAAGKAPLWQLPLRIYTALVIATSCLRAPLGDWDARRLGWLLIQATSKKSWLCRLAASIWFRRLRKQYPEVHFLSSVMAYIAQNYYEAGHPFGTYWVDR